MRKVLIGSAVIALVIGASALSFWAGSRNAANQPAPAAKAPAGPAKGPPAIVVEASKVAVVNLPQSLTAVGSLRSDETVILRPEIAGRVSQIGFREGERVAKGQMLL